MTAYLAGRDVMAPPQRGLAREVHAAVAVGLLPAEPRQPRLVLLRLDELGRDRLAEFLPRLDGVPERLQEPGRARHGQLGRGLHLQHLRLRHDRRDGAAAGSRLPSAGGDPRRDAARRPQALYEPKGKPIEFGVVRPGLLADLVIVPEDPVAEPQGALRHGRRAPERARPARPSGSAASGTRSRTASSTTRGSCSRTSRGWWRSRRRSAASRGCPPPSSPASSHERACRARPREPVRRRGADGPPGAIRLEPGNGGIQPLPARGVDRG